MEIFSTNINRPAKSKNGAISETASDVIYKSISIHTRMRGKCHSINKPQSLEIRYIFDLLAELTRLKFVKCFILQLVNYNEGVKGLRYFFSAFLYNKLQIKIYL